MESYFKNFSLLTRSTNMYSYLGTTPHSTQQKMVLTSKGSDAKMLRFISHHIYCNTHTDTHLLPWNTYYSVWHAAGLVVCFCCVKAWGCFYSGCTALCVCVSACYFVSVYVCQYMYVCVCHFVCAFMNFSVIVFLITSLKQCSSSPSTVYVVGLVYSLFVCTQVTLYMVVGFIPYCEDILRLQRAVRGSRLGLVQTWSRVQDDFRFVFYDGYSQNKL